MATLQSPTSDFPQFPTLPIELQRIIWHHATISIPPRLIDLYLLYTTHSHVPLPSLLHTCQESRSAVRKHYEPWGAYTTSLHGGGPEMECAAFSHAYVDLRKDVFVLQKEIVGGATVSTAAGDARWWRGDVVGRVRRVAMLLEDYRGVMEVAACCLDGLLLPNDERVEGHSVVIPDVFNGVRWKESLGLGSLTVLLNGQGQRGWGKLEIYGEGQMDWVLDCGCEPFTVREVFEGLGIDIGDGGLLLNVASVGEP